MSDSRVSGPFLTSGVGTRRGALAAGVVSDGQILGRSRRRSILWGGMSSPFLVFLTCFGLAVAGALLVGEPHADAAGVSSGGFVSVTSARLLDTRVGTGAPAHPVAANSTLALQVTGRAGVPTTGVSAVVLNVTVTSPAKAGSISAYPDASALPSTSNLNF